MKLRAKTSSTHNEGRYVSVPRAAEILGVSDRTVGRLVDAGKLEAFTPSKQRRVTVESIQRHLEASKEGGYAALPVMSEDLLAD